MRTVLVINAHPRPDSLCDALADRYAAAAAEAGARVERLDLRALHFDPILHAGYAAPQALEPDLARAQRLITEAQHIAVVYPNWWGTFPALLKGFVDRVFLPGWAFRFRAGRSTWDKLLAGRSARLLVTMDWPGWAYRLFVGAPGHRAMARATLGFCGIDPVRLTVLGQVRTSTADRRARWLEQVAREAAADVRRAASRPVAAVGREEAA